MGSVSRNVRHSVRLLWNSPAFTLTAVVCLGLGIGANTALFSIFNTLLWKPLPVDEPQEIVRVFGSRPTQGRLFQGFSLPDYDEYLRENDTLAGLVATTGVQVSFRAGGNDAVRAFGEAVSDNYFVVLGVSARIGRVLLPRPDGTPNNMPEVVLSDRFWQTRLHSDPEVVGKTIWLTGVAFTVAGVTNAGFNGTYPSPIFAPEFWLPLAAAPLIDGRRDAWLRSRADRSISLLGRLKKGATLTQAQAAFDTIAARLEHTYADTNKGLTVKVFRELDTHPEVYSSRALNLIAMLFLGLAALVLAVACANLANLMLARAAARRREVAVRLALGATRGQLIQQLAIDALLLSLVAGAVGLLGAAAALRAVSSVRLPFDLPIVFDVAIDQRAWAFTLAISILAGITFGLVPALSASRSNLVPALKSGPTIGSSGRRRFTLANGLVVLQVACSVVLIVAAGLFWRSVAGSNAVDPGLQLAGRSLVSFSPSLLRYDVSQAEAFYRRLLERVRQTPGIESAALVAWVPLGFAFEERGFIIHGEDAAHGPEARPMQRTVSLLDVVSPTAFETMGVPIRSGRTFSDQDSSAAPAVAIVNETFARRAWPGGSPLGRKVRVDREKSEWLTVIGVAADGKYRTLTEPPMPCLFRPLAQEPVDALTLVAKFRDGHRGTIAAIRREVQALDPNMPCLDVKTMDQQMAKVRFVPQALTALAGPAALIAMLIAAIGLYGVIAYSVGRRTSEFGIRLSIGAQRRDVTAMVMSQGLWLVGIGLLSGLGAAFALSRVMQRLLVGVSASDPAVFGGTAVLIMTVGALATYVPARRASRVDPLIALRQE
jgi:predicted permease